MSKILIIVLLLILTGCNSGRSILNVDYAEKIASEENFKDDYYYTIQPAYNCQYDDAYIVTFYNHTIINELITTYLVYRIGDEVHWVVINYE